MENKKILFWLYVQGIKAKYVKTSLWYWNSKNHTQLPNECLKKPQGEIKVPVIYP